MAYEKTVWVNGQAPALDADHLNKMEQGIADAVSVTPQTLSDEQKAQARANIGAAKAYTTQPRASVQLNTDYAPDATSPTAKITKDDSGNVHMQIWNLVTTAAIPNYVYATIATLEAEYCPPVMVLGTVRVWKGSTLYTCAMGTVSSNGEVQINAGGDLSGAVAIPAGSVICLSAAWAV